MLSHLRSIILTGAIALSLVGCVTPEPPQVIAEVIPVPAPEIPPLKKLADILNAQGFVTKETERGLVVYLPSLYFDIDSATLNIDAQAKIRAISDVINRPEFVEHQIAVEGHTDSLGDAENNMELSRQRAETVADHLVFSNVSTGRIEIAWFGETAPLEPNRNPDGTDNADNRAKNRRVEFIIIQRES
ncbi:MAG: OmpA family protein [Granulosicoccus sp.]|nr:OmpA family protein [Granulosicoccus sp.]